MIDLINGSERVRPLDAKYISQVLMRRIVDDNFFQRLMDELNMNSDPRFRMLKTVFYMKAANMIKDSHPDSVYFEGDEGFEPIYSVVESAAGEAYVMLVDNASKVIEGTSLMHIFKDMDVRYEHELHDPQREIASTLFSRGFKSVLGLPKELFDIQRDKDDLLTSISTPLEGVLLTCYKRLMREHVESLACNADFQFPVISWLTEVFSDRTPIGLNKHTAKGLVWNAEFNQIIRKTQLMLKNVVSEVDSKYAVERPYLPEKIKLRGHAQKTLSNISSSSWDPDSGAADFDDAVLSLSGLIKFPTTLSKKARICSFFVIVCRPN